MTSQGSARRGGRPLAPSYVPRVVSTLDRRPDLAEARLVGALVAESVRWSA